MIYDEAQHQNIDRLVRASLARLTLGISPASAMLTYLDWLSSSSFLQGLRLIYYKKQRRNIYAY